MPAGASQGGLEVRREASCRRSRLDISMASALAGARGVPVSQGNGNSFIPLIFGNLHKLGGQDVMLRRAPGNTMKHPGGGRQLRG